MITTRNNKSNIKTAIIGFGYWGPNLLRTFFQNDDVNVVYCYDKVAERLNIVNKLYPSVKTFKNYEEILSDSSVDVVVIATPLSSHFELAKKALLAKKHVWVEKPMTKTSDEAQELISLASKNNKILFVDHIFLYSKAVTTLKRIVDNGNFGKIHYFDSIRINLGLFQHDSNVIWDLAIHDITIMRYLLGIDPSSVNVFGSSHIKPGLEDTAYINFRFPTELTAHIAISWLSPVKIRRTLIAGSNKMIVYDDLDISEKVKIYDSGVSIAQSYKPDSTTSGYQYRIGDIQIPAIENKEALQIACDHFISSIKSNKQPLTDGLEGLKVIKILEALDTSLRDGGRTENITLL